MTETQNSGTNFATAQKVDVIEVIERLIPQVAQECLGEHCPDFIDKNSWPPNSPDLNPLDYHVWGAMLEKFSELKPKPQNVAELKKALLTISDDLPNETVRKSVLSYRKRLAACIKAEGKHFEHSLN